MTVLHRLGFAAVAITASYVLAMSSTGCFLAGEITVCRPLTEWEWAISMLPVVAALIGYEGRVASRGDAVILDWVRDHWLPLFVLLGTAIPTGFSFLIAC